MKRVHSPHHGREVVVGGRRRPVHLVAPSAGRRMLKLADYMKLAALPTPPTSLDLTSAAATPLANVYGNDSLGDCVIAGYYHVKGVETGNATPGGAFVATDAQILADYSAIGGYVPGDASTDQGCDEVTALDHWHDPGDQAGTKIAGYVLLDATNVQELQIALDLFGNHYFGVELPDAWISPFPSGPGFTWDVAGDPDPNNGHCFIGAGYDTSGVLIDTWGMIGKLTYAAVAKYAAAANGGQVYAILTPDQLAAGQTKAPNGIDWTALQSDLASLGSWPQP